MYNDYEGYQLPQTEVKSLDIKDNEMSITFDLENFKYSIIDTLKSNIISDIRSTIKNIVLNELENSIKDSVNGIVKDMIVEVYNSKTITVGGGFNEEPKTYTIKEFSLKEIENSIKNNIVKTDKYSTKKFEQYFTEQCIDNSVNKFIKLQLTNAKNKIDTQLKAVFSAHLNNMLSEVATGVLSTSSQYKDLIGKLGISQIQGD